MPLIAPSLRLGTTAQGLQVINSVDPCVLKCNYYIDFKPQGSMEFTNLKAWPVVPENTMLIA